MKTNASVSAHSDSNPNLENLDRLNVLEMEVKRMASEHASELANMARKLAALESGGNAHHNGNGTLLLESESTALTDRRGMMKKLAGLAAGVAAVGLLRPTKSVAGKFVPDITGGPLLLGDDNFADDGATVVTRLLNPGDALNNNLFQVDNFGSSPFSGPAATSIAVVGHVNTAGATPVNNAAIGVYGSGISAGTGDATGVFGIGTDFGVSGSGQTGVQGVGGALGGFFTGTRAALNAGTGTGAVADPNVNDPLGGPGDVYRGSTNGSLWYRTGGPGSYRRVADNNTAGALTAFAASSRFVNLSTLNAGATATYQIGGVTVTGNTVPSKARAIIGRIADANPTGGGGSILVGATNPPVGGVIAVVAGAPQNSSFFSALDATGKLYVKNTSPSGSVQIIIDIQGYYE